uniref:Uncharacterized protein n=1 Tax=Arundo donax TaxID=35708 RepID=A0A0A9AT56_ARUDO
MGSREAAGPTGRGVASGDSG